MKVGELPRLLATAEAKGYKAGLEKVRAVIERRMASAKQVKIGYAVGMPGIEDEACIAAEHAERVCTEILADIASIRALAEKG